MIGIKNFKSNLLKTDKNSYKNFDIYCTRYIAIKNIGDGDHEGIYSANSLNFIIGEVDEMIEEKNGNRYLFFVSNDKSKEVLTKYKELWDAIKNLTKIIYDKPGEYGKDFRKIKFNADDNLPLNKILQLHNLTVIVRSFFQEEKKNYPQFFLDECLHDL